MLSFLVPIVSIVVALLLAPRSWLAGPCARAWAIRGALVCVTLVVARYLWWRVTETLPIGSDLSRSGAVFSWALFSIEMASWTDTAILFLTLSRQRNNSAVADHAEDLLRDTKPADLPYVDVFIATFNEDLDVLEKTIVGATSLDWPRDRLKIYVLDDGKRQWLAEYCASQGVRYLTRETNEHAKAGNINAAIKRTDGEFFMVLDADFVPQHNFLFRAIGLFDDPKVGIVQIPHNFYNADPMQTNLGLRKSLPDDQRLFFETIMCGRDGWDNAFCCGSNSITRRTAIEAIGGSMPTGSITEDMLLTMALLRKGFVTRYLNERLAVGLAPESLSAMYVQRCRWARGAIQMLFLREGPLGPGLRPMQRIMFLPLHWITQPWMISATLLTPTICLWTGWSPLPTATIQDIVSFQFPALLATLGIICLIAPKSFFPLASTVHAAIHVPRIMPTVINTLLRPHGHAFKVTPKGSAAGSAADTIMVYAPIIVILLSASGLYLNLSSETRLVTSLNQVPMLAFWAIASMVVLSIVQVVAISSNRMVRGERFDVDLTCAISTFPSEYLGAKIEDLSMSGAGLRLDDPCSIKDDVEWICLVIPDVGSVAAQIQRRGAGKIGVAFEFLTQEQRHVLLQILFTRGLDNSTHIDHGLSSSIQLIKRVLTSDTRPSAPNPVHNGHKQTLPDWLRIEVEQAEVRPNQPSISAGM